MITFENLKDRFGNITSIIYILLTVACLYVLYTATVNSNARLEENRRIGNLESSLNTINETNSELNDTLTLELESHRIDLNATSTNTETLNTINDLEEEMLNNLDDLVIPKPKVDELPVSSDFDKNETIPVVEDKESNGSVVVLAPVGTIVTVISTPITTSPPSNKETKDPRIDAEALRNIMALHAMYNKIKSTGE